MSLFRVIMFFGLLFRGSPRHAGLCGVTSGLDVLLRCYRQDAAWVGGKDRHRSCWSGG